MRAMRVELHTHTHFSKDGLTSPEVFVERYVRAGIDCVAVTEHDYFRPTASGGILSVRHSSRLDMPTQLESEGLSRYLAQYEPLPEDLALTFMRQQSQRLAEGRVVFGGKRGDKGVADNADRYAGKMSGIYEETLASL